MARVYSYLDGNPKHDNDLRANKKGGNKTDAEQFAEYVQEHKHDLESKHTVEQMFIDWKESKK